MLFEYYYSLGELVNRRVLMCGDDLEYSVAGLALDRVCVWGKSISSAPSCCPKAKEWCFHKLRIDRIARRAPHRHRCFSILSQRRLFVFRNRVWLNKCSYLSIMCDCVYVLSGGALSAPALDTLIASWYFSISQQPIRRPVPHSHHPIWCHVIVLWVLFT